MQPSIIFSSATFLITSSLVLASLSSKALGVAWVLLVILGFAVWIKNCRRINEVAIPRWVLVWVFCTLIAMTIKLILTAYWSDPWGERHGELRMFLGALAAYGLLCLQPLPRKALLQFAYALSLSSLIGLFWVSLYGRNAVPTHPIPWAGSLAMVSALLLALSLKSDFSLWHRRLWFMGGLFAVMAVLASQSRGAYAIVFWWLGVCTHHLFIRRSALFSSKGQSRYRDFFIGFIALFLALFVLSQSPVFKRASQSMHDAVHEINVSKQSTAQGSNSSVGARIYMWQNSLSAISQSPWIGHGHDTRKQLLQHWADTANSHEIKRLGHVHNEYLHQLIDHGLLGLASQLLYLFGLAYCVWYLRKNAFNMAALAVSGIAFVHMTSSITNVNFAHNYYTGSLSLFILIGFWLSRIAPQTSDV